MENTQLIKRSALAEKLILSLCFLLIMSCKGQATDKATATKEKMMNTEKFDIAKYNKCIDEREKNPLLDLSRCEDTLQDGTIIVSSRSSEDYTTIITPPPPSIIQTYKRYYRTGFLQEKSERYIGYAMGSDVIKFGNTLLYDPNGTLVKTIDETEKYKSLVIKPLDLFEILKKEPLFKELSRAEQVHFKKILDLSTQEAKITTAEVCKALQTYVVLDSKSDKERRNVYVQLSDDQKLWFVTKDLYPYGLIKLEVETSTGKILTRTYHEETRP